MEFDYWGPGVDYQNGWSKGHTSREKPQRSITSCLGTLFARPDWNAELIYDANPLHQRGVDYDAATCRITPAEVKEHVLRLKQAGFVFEYSMGERKFNHLSTNSKGVAPVPAHIFYVPADANTPVMRRFLFNGIRWISENRNCRIAYAELLKNVNQSDQLACFNMFVISSLADTRTGNHNIGAHRGYIEPFTLEKFTQMRNDKGCDNYMMGHVKLIKNSTFDMEQLSDFAFLMKPGGYEEYMKRLNAARAYAEAAKKNPINSERMALRGLLGLDAPVGAVRT